jgi:hypothetical protein
MMRTYVRRAVPTTIQDKSTASPPRAMSRERFPHHSPSMHRMGREFRGHHRWLDASWSAATRMVCLPPWRHWGGSSRHLTSGQNRARACALSDRRRIIDQVTGECRRIRQNATTAVTCQVGLTEAHVRLTSPAHRWLGVDPRHHGRAVARLATIAASTPHHWHAGCPTTSVRSRWSPYRRSLRLRTSRSPFP